MDDLFLNLRALVLALLVHGLLFAALFQGLGRTPPPAPQEEVEVVQAVAVDEAQVQKELQRLTALEEAKEAERRRLEEKARKAKEMLERERQRLKALEEERRKEEQQRKAEAERLSALKRKREEEAKRLEALRKQQAEEARRLKALEEERRKEEEAKRRAERKAAEARRRQAAEEALKKKLAEEERRLQAERARKAEMLVERYKGIIRQKVERNWRRPLGVPRGLSCIVRVRLLPTGDVGEVSIVKSSGNPPFDASVRRAVMKASPLPLPKDRKLFPYFRELEFVFAPKA